MVCDAQAIGSQVDGWISESELPVSSRLQVESRFDGLYPEDEDERQAYFDFVSWYMNLDWLPILSIPQKHSDAWFPQREFDEQGNDISAFNSMDFLRLNGWKPNVEAWQLKQVMEKLFDLAQTHSCITNEEGRKNIKERFDRIVYKNFTRPYYYNGQAKYLKRLQDAEKIWKETAFQA